MEGHGRYFRCGTDHYGDRISAWKDWKIIRSEAGGHRQVLSFFHKIKKKT